MGIQNFTWSCSGRKLSLAHLYRCMFFPAFGYTPLTPNPGVFCFPEIRRCLVDTASGCGTLRMTVCLHSRGIV